MSDNQSSTKKIWEGIKSLIGGLFITFLYAMGSLAIIGSLLSWALGTDLSESPYLYRLFLLNWVGWIIGLQLYYKHQDDERLEEQLTLLRQGKSVYNPHPKLNEKWEEEKKFMGYMEKRREQEITAARDPFALSDQSKAQIYKQNGLTKDESNEIRK